MLALDASFMGGFSRGMRFVAQASVLLTEFAAQLPPLLPKCVARGEGGSLRLPVGSRNSVLAKGGFPSKVK